MTPFYDKNAEGLKAGYGHHIIESLEIRLEFYICPRCSAVVTDWHKHEWWHRSGGDRARNLAAWLYENHGVLVTPDAEGLWTCQNCGRRNVFANLIDHADDCVYKLGTEGLL